MSQEPANLQIDQQGLKILLAASNQGSKITKKQAEIDVRGLVEALVNASGLKRPRMTLRHFMGSMAIFASMVKGLCFVFDRRVEILVHDCEIIAVRKIEIQAPNLPPRPSTSSKRRLSSTTVAARRVSMISAPEPVDFESMMDLDSLCADLNRRKSVTGPQLTPIPRGKKSRSGSSSVSAEEAENVFEAAADVAFDDVDLALGPLAGLPELPTSPPPSPPRPTRRRQQRRQAKGFNPKTTMTAVEWATMLRAEKITSRYFSMTPADFGREQFLRPPSVGSVDETVSVAEAVDLESLMDELRGDDENNVFDDEQVVPDRNRLSVASSFAPTERRHSIASDVFMNDTYAPRSKGPADDLKSEIKRALSSRHAKPGTMIGFSDIAPIGMVSRRVAASVLMQLLVLGTRTEIKFDKTIHTNFTQEPLFVLSSEVDDDDDDYF